ncbi:hypothetical protein IE53DRAFT_390530 [Violaceomyces palustris]|uniref:Uncharacterized protein n=1 Tax=Violaceomyces palustris TaxID=1673888 RepID=A0ACD0NNC8_9BASI|nr:hypothetical protein IE53DRAFT_390530 [Violaceomyces palustris]
MSPRVGRWKGSWKAQEGDRESLPSFQFLADVELLRWMVGNTSSLDERGREGETERKGEIQKRGSIQLERSPMWAGLRGSRQPESTTSYRTALTRSESTPRLWELKDLPGTQPKRWTFQAVPTVGPCPLSSSSLPSFSRFFTSNKIRLRQLAPRGSSFLIVPEDIIEERGGRRGRGGGRVPKSYKIKI